MKFFVLACTLAIGFGFEDKSITQYLKDNGYTALSSALEQTGLSAALNGNGPFTIFAPTDAAFQKVSTSGLTQDQLTSILKYHVVSEFVLVPMISQSTSKTTLNNQTLTIQPVGGALVLNAGSSAAARVSTTNNDIIVNNGVVQPIDNILMPPVLPTVPPPATTAHPPSNYTIYQLLLRDDTRFKDLSLSLLLAGVVPELESIEYTLFAPVDSAFAVYKDNLLNPTAPNAQAIYREVMRYHMVVGARRASQLRTGLLYTAHLQPVNVTVSSGGVRVNDANVIDADIIASKGIIHAIDKILIPPDINQVANGRK